MRTRTPKRQKQERLYYVLRERFLNENPICQVEGCGQEATQAHHKKGRLGELLTDIRYFLAVCADCHIEIEMNPTWAKEKGYSLSRLAKVVN